VLQTCRSLWGSRCGYRRVPVAVQNTPMPVGMKPGTFQDRDNSLFNGRAVRLQKKHTNTAQPRLLCVLENRCVGAFDVHLQQINVIGACEA
jgi:hypothetical protein